MNNLYNANENMTSVVSAPERGPWGDARFRGNCDGTLIKDLILRYRPATVADPMEGSGTCRDVVAGIHATGQHNITYWGSDLAQGFDLAATRLPGQFDFVWVHPPYWNMIRYSDDPTDLSQAPDYQSFSQLLQACLLNCYRSLAAGGRLAVLVGDLRRSGRYYPLIRDVLNLDGHIGSVKSVVIKTQHNCKSNSRRYTNLVEPRIMHEYCVVVQRAHF